jgi:predicted transcriptional regulator
MTGRGAIAFLSGSEHRVALLCALRQPRRPSELEADTDASRATVQRSLSGFTERGWARKDGREYRLTVAGELVLEAYRDAERVIETVAAAGPGLAHLAGVELPAEALAGATVVTASDRTPHAPIEHYVEAVRNTETERFHGMSPVVSGIFDEAHQGLVARVPAELIVDRNTLATARETTPEAVAAAADTESLTVHVHPEPLAFGLGICDDRAFVGAYDDQGRMRACIEGDGPLLEWAREQFAAHRERSEPVEPTG